MDLTKLVSFYLELYLILYEFYKMMHAYALKQTSLSTVLLQYGGPSAIQARDEFHKCIGSVWNSEVNGRPSSGEWWTVCRRKFWGPVFVQRLGVGGHDSLTVRDLRSDSQ